MLFGRWKRPQDVERIGIYPFLNRVDGPSGGTFRQVWQRGDVPDPGAQVMAYSTFLVPNTDPFPYGGRCGMPPDPRSGGAIFDFSTPLRNLPTPAAPQPGMPNVGGSGYYALFGLQPPANQKPTGG